MASYVKITERYAIAMKTSIDVMDMPTNEMLQLKSRLRRYINRDFMGLVYVGDVRSEFALALKAAEDIISNERLLGVTHD